MGRVGQMRKDIEHKTHEISDRQSIGRPREAALRYGPDVYR